MHLHYSLLIGVWLFAFPESPKFLIEVGEPDEALEILKDIYQQNTGRDRENFPVSKGILLNSLIHLAF